MRRIREVESRKLNEELKRRMMKINAMQEEEDLSENSEDDTQSDTNFDVSNLTLPMPSKTLAKHRNKSNIQQNVHPVVVNHSCT